MSSNPRIEPEIDGPERPQPADPSPPTVATWPETKLVSMMLTVALGFALGLPFLTARDDVPLLALVAGALGATTGRLTFHSRSVSMGGRVGLRGVLGSIPPAAVALGISMACARAGGIDAPMWSLAGTLIATPAVFVLAAELRALEVRYLRSARRVFLIGSEDQFRDVAREVRRQTDVSLVGFVSVAAGTGLLGAEQIDTLTARVAAAGPTMLVLSSEATRSDGFCAVAARLRMLGCRVRDLTSFYERHFRKEPLSELTPSWFLFDVAEIHRPRLYGACKRSSEALLAAAGLVVAAPVLAAIAVAVKFSSPGPALFRQVRVGKGDEPFTLVKFRTMRCAAEGTIAGWAGSERERITGVGRLLRRFRLDELPQLWNVVRGQLSLVGPRPEQVELVRRLEGDIEYYRARHCVRPGMTGWAQINYGYGGSRDGTLEKLQYDFYYVKCQSLRLDLLILASTARAVFAGAGS
ncbi:MAG: exopolysaccharide biosynthesis polyprenyl glycosylphosphotransferase [Solirubrobacteraceae bacterium]